MYSLKKPKHWLWRTNFTREQVLERLDERKISEDWLICPLGEAAKAVPVADFAADPSLFEAYESPSSRGSAEATRSATEADSKGERQLAARIPRRHDLDALRATAMLLGIGLHGALAYVPMPDAGWPVHDVRQNEVYAIFMAAIHGFRMPLFFLISGFFTAMLWRKRGLAALLKHRFKRIFLPLLIGTFTIVPAVWAVSIAAGIVGSLAVDDNAEADIWAAAVANDADKILNSLAHGASPNDLDPASGATALSIASTRGHVEAMERLIASGADVNFRNRDGSTPLHGAIMFCRVDAVGLLMQHGADVDMKNRIGESVTDMLDVDGARLLIFGALNGMEVDDLTGKDEIVAMLRRSDQLSPSQSEQLSSVVTSSVSVPSPSTLVMLMLTIFPLFHHLWFLWFLCWLVAGVRVICKSDDALHVEASRVVGDVTGTLRLADPSNAASTVVDGCLVSQLWPRYVHRLAADASNTAVLCDLFSVRSDLL